MASPLRLGLLVPQYGASAEEALAGARAAERAGLDIWVAGQLLPMSGASKPSLEPLTLMGAIAAATSSARLGFMVLAAPYLPPFYYAKALLSLDELSGGRLEIGLGAGWREEEFAALGLEREPLSRRLDALEAILAALDSAPSWGRKSTPVWIAGGGSKVLALAARHAQWTNFARGISVEEFRHRVETAVDAAAEAGRKRPPRASLTATFLAAADEGELQRRLAERASERGIETARYAESLREANVFLGTPAAIAAQMRPFLDVGCEAIVLWPLDGEHERGAGLLAAVARELAALAR